MFLYQYTPLSHSVFHAQFVTTLYLFVIHVSFGGWVLGAFQWCVTNIYFYLFIVLQGASIVKRTFLNRFVAPSQKKKNKIEHVQPHCVHCEAYQVISLFPHYQNENVSTLFTCEVSGWRTKSKQEGQR